MSQWIQHWLGIFAVLAMLAVAGCAPDFANSPNAPGPVIGQDIAAPKLANGFIVADDGTKLPMRTWMPRGLGNMPAPVEGVIVAVHGFNDYSAAFSMPAEVWARNGIATIAYDQRGFGANLDAGRWPGTEAMCQDLAAALRLARQRFPDEPVYVLGESMGGAVVLNSVTTNEHCKTPKPDGVILVGPAVWARSTMPLVNRVALWVGSRLMPGAAFTGEGLGVVASDNYGMLRKLGRDPLFIKATRVDAIYGLADLMDGALSSAPHDHLPTLLLYGAHDEVIPQEPMHDFVTGLPGLADGTQRIAYYRGGWHMLLRDLEGPVVAEDVVAWIRDHQAPLPSGADLAVDALLGSKPPTITASAR